jgi:hypothetical protein
MSGFETRSTASERSGECRSSRLQAELELAPSQVSLLGFAQIESCTLAQPTSRTLVQPMSRASVQMDLTDIADNSATISISEVGIMGRVGVGNVMTHFIIIVVNIGVN